VGKVVVVEITFFLLLGVFFDMMTLELVNRAWGPGSLGSLMNMHLLLWAAGSVHVRRWEEEAGVSIPVPAWKSTCAGDRSL